MASSSSCALPSIESTSPYTCQTDEEMESSKARHWSELDESASSATSAGWSAESNYEYFAELKSNPEWGRFFKDFRALKVGEKISEGAQADVYEACLLSEEYYDRGVFPDDMVVKVMKGHASLQALQAQWPIGMLSARSGNKRVFDIPMTTIMAGTLLQDERFRGRFAFVMHRRWGDLRLLIDRRMEKKCPFSIDQAVHLMRTIAQDMDILHTKYGIIHRDLKASNVLVWKSKDVMQFGGEMNICDDGIFEAVVADFECSRLVMGTRFWRAPEIFQQMKDGVPSSEVKFTTMSDVYSFGMTSYEILSGFTPFDPKLEHCTIEEVLSGRRPNLSSDVPLDLRRIIMRCWHANPEERPSFQEICKLLLLKQICNPVAVVINNNIQNDAITIKIKQSRKIEHLTLLQVTERLVCMELSILKATTSITFEMVEYYLEVSYYEGGKVCDVNVIANIEEVLSSPMTMELVYCNCCIYMEGPNNKIYNRFRGIYVIEIYGLEGPLLLGAFATILTEMSYCVREVKCWTYDESFECAMFVVGVKEMTLLTKIITRLLINLPSMPIYYNFVLHELLAEDASSYMENFKPRNLSVPPNYKCSGIEPRLVEQGLSFRAKDFSLKPRGLRKNVVKVFYIFPPSWYGHDEDYLRRLSLPVLQSLKKVVDKGKRKLTLEGGIRQFYDLLENHCGSQVNALSRKNSRTSSIHGSYDYTKKTSEPFVLVVV